MNWPIYRKMEKDKMVRPSFQLREWMLPEWYHIQANPHSVYFCESSLFKNLTHRNWTALRPEGSGDYYLLDSNGILQIPKGATFEIWLEDSEFIFTPNRYRVMKQYYSPDFDGVETKVHTENLQIKVDCRQSADRNGLDLRVTVMGWDQRYSLRPISIMLAYRPFGNDGLASTYRLEYRDLKMIADGRQVLELDNEPSISLFGNELTRDPLAKLGEGKGNASILSAKGWCTGVIGYRGLPGELAEVRFSIIDRLDKSPRKKSDYGQVTEKYPDYHQIGRQPTVNTGTDWDDFFRIGIRQMDIFCPAKPGSVDIWQVLAMNRVGMLDRSASLLEACFKKVRVNGELAPAFLGTDKLIYAVYDYLEFGGNRGRIESAWPLIKRVALYLAETTGWGNEKSRALWQCVSLRAFIQLAMELRRPDDLAQFRICYLKLLQRISRVLESTPELAEIYSDGSISEIIDGFGWGYPFHFWRDNLFEDGDWLDSFERLFIKDGGVCSPVEFKGIDLELTARFCQYLVWYGKDYREVMHFLKNCAGNCWCWPDKIHPLTFGGIGKFGHTPAVLYQVFLLWRLILIHEVGDDLYLLPGIFFSKIWDQPQLEVANLPTKFGLLSLTCRTMGSMTRIGIQLSMSKPPAKLIFKIGSDYQVMFADRPLVYRENVVEIEPDVKMIKLKKCTI